MIFIAVANRIESTVAITHCVLDTGQCSLHVRKCAWMVWWEMMWFRQTGDSGSQGSKALAFMVMF